jgi:hypothetical protein
MTNIYKYTGMICFIIDDDSEKLKFVKETQNTIETLGKCKVFFVKDFNVDKKNWDYRVINGIEVYIGIFRDNNPVIVIPHESVLSWEEDIKNKNY